MLRRILGIETEYGVTCMDEGARTLSADEVARYLFRKVVSWGRSSNVFMKNGSRLYLDVGSHPEYATAECDSPRDVVIHDRAGERIMESLIVEAQSRLDSEGVAGQIYLFKNNTDSVGNSYGCHENYLIPRQGEFGTLASVLLPFLVTRQIVVGAGKVLTLPKGTLYCFSQRADHMWEGVSSATTRSRPIINTRDEPHSDAEQYRRLHVIVGDSNMSEVTTLVKVTSTHLLLHALEQGFQFPDYTLENPIRAIREISHDITGSAKVKLENGTRASALDIQDMFFEKVSAFCDKEGINDKDSKYCLDVWGRCLDAIRDDRPERMSRELDWAIKLSILDRYKNKLDADWQDPRIARLDLAYHDITRTRGIFYKLENKGAVDRISIDPEVFRAQSVPPQTTRAKLRGDFVRQAQAKHRDFTVDWVHLKLNDLAQRTVLCKDPFKNQDDRVERLINAM